MRSEQSPVSLKTILKCDKGGRGIFSCVPVPVVQFLLNGKCAFLMANFVICRETKSGVCSHSFQTQQNCSGLRGFSAFGRELDQAYYEIISYHHSDTCLGNAPAIPCVRKVHGSHMKVVLGPQLMAWGGWPLQPGIPSPCFPGAASLR